jgi:hypothetical protein
VAGLVQEAPVLSAKVAESTGLILELSNNERGKALPVLIPDLHLGCASPKSQLAGNDQLLRPGHPSLVMIVAAGLLVAGMGSLALIARALRKAPPGYEDEHGFHIVRNKAVSRVFPGSMTTKIRASRGLRRGRAQYQRNHG